MDKAQLQKSSTTTGKKNASLTKTRTSKTSSQQHSVFNNSPLQNLNSSNLLTPVHLLHLQRTLGNQAVGRIIQAKLTISHPDDPYEREADQVADKVMRMPEPATSDEEETTVQTKPLTGQITPLVYRMSENIEEEAQQPVQAKQDESTGQEEESVIAPKPLIQRVPSAIREDDEEEKVSPKLESGANKEEEEKPLQTKLAHDIYLQREAKEEEEKREEFLVAAPMIHRQMEDETEELLQTKVLQGARFRTPNVHPPTIYRIAALSTIQRLCSECEEKMQQQGKPTVAQRKTARYQLHDDHDEEEQKLQPKGDPAHTPQVTSSIAANIQALKYGGSSLPKATRAFFEPRFSADFSQVRVHTGSQAAETAKSINARAFTVGQNIAFGVGQYAPESSEGKRLLAHELTHVLQQSSFSSKNSTLRQHAHVANKERNRVSSRHLMFSTLVANREPAPKLIELNHAPVTTAFTFRSVDYIENKDTRQLSGLIQRSFFSDVWQGITEVGPAVARAMQLVTTLMSNPAQLPIVLGSIVWEEIPERFKGPIIDQVLQACLALARAIELPSPPGVLPIGAILKHVAIGFLERALRFPTGMKVRVANRMARIVTSPSMDFSLGYLKGLVIGLWDGLTGPFVLLWDLIKIAYQIQLAQMRFIVGMFNQQARERLGRDVQAALERVEGRLAQVVAQLMNSQSNPLAILRWIDQLINTVLRQVESLGASLADALLRFLHKPDRELGESLGWLGGTLTFEVLLLVLTEGGYTVLRNSVKGLRLVVRAVEMGGRAWEALGPARAALAGFRAFAMSNRALAPLLEAVEEVFALLARFLRFSYGVGGPGGAAARGAEHGAGAAERGVVREIRVADTATRETHEITLLADGRLIRCSDRCVQIAESIIERSGRLERTGLQAEGSRLTEEARRISEEARTLKANEALSATEREVQETALLQRAEALERQMASAERRLMEGLSEGADNAVDSVRTLLRENAGNSRLRPFQHELETLEQDIARNRQLARESLDSDMRRLIEDEFRDLDRRARDLEARMRGELPAAPVVPGAIPRPHLSYPRSHLPTGGAHPYRSPGPGEVVQHPEGQGFLDMFGNKWQVDRTKARAGRFFEWDVQHPNGLHTNVGIDGSITHGPDNF